ncbi:hypothetical protein F4813DRAFT_345348 [Daldinia decipiens]|uniref:uncharacterized protein n=1 Tax=Daldinia decipiens TaxID=326647 RepID=UPI0020C3CE54|nr:uncharacterized protein F4813DRAFT_345348 [Daldinia decipiens]KAI1661689.1 hypothetical protein F4813DRAFT_345348 [Daldinia decipiens]
MDSRPLSPQPASIYNLRYHLFPFEKTSDNICNAGNYIRASVAIRGSTIKVECKIDHSRYLFMFQLGSYTRNTLHIMAKGLTYTPLLRSTAAHPFSVFLSLSFFSSFLNLLDLHTYTPLYVESIISRALFSLFFSFYLLALCLQISSIGHLLVRRTLHFALLSGLSFAVNYQF